MLVGVGTGGDPVAAGIPGSATSPARSAVHPCLRTSAAYNSVLTGLVLSMTTPPHHARRPGGVAQSCHLCVQRPGRPPVVSSLFSRPLRGTSAAAIAALLLSAVPGVGLVGKPPSAHAATTIEPTVVSFASEVSESWTVPAGVTEISVSAIGGRAGDTGSIYNNHRTLGALGGAVSGTLSVAPGQVLHVRVGGNGGLAMMYNPSEVIAGGTNGGLPGVSDHYYPPAEAAGPATSGPAAPASATGSWLPAGAVGMPHGFRAGPRASPARCST